MRWHTRDGRRSPPPTQPPPPSLSPAHDPRAAAASRAGMPGGDLPPERPQLAAAAPSAPPVPGGPPQPPRPAASPPEQPRHEGVVNRLGARVHRLMHPAHAPAASPAWAQRCHRAGQPKQFAQTPEVQVAAHLYDVRIRVYSNDGKGHYLLGFCGNPNAKRGTLNLALTQMHFRWVQGHVEADRFAADGKIAHHIKNVAPDGNCFYQCVADAVAHAPSSASKVRYEVARALLAAEQMPVDGDPDMSLAQAFPP